jgi:spectinomycin phosphotransferase
MMREQPDISEERLRACLWEYYNVHVATVEFLPVGLDYQAGVYRTVSEEGIAYLVKVKSGVLYEPACSMPTYLKDLGILSVVAPMPTLDRQLWSTMGTWSVLVYPFLEGDTSWNGMTDEQWKETGCIFKQIHQVVPPTTGVGQLRAEKFDSSGYAQWIETFETQHLLALPSEASASQRSLRSSWLRARPIILAALATLEQLGKVLRGRNLPCVICHADLHPANLLRDALGHVHVVDWDEMMLAPRERDFIFIKESEADSATLPGSPSFFQGYGPADIDWIALTYYRYERVIQDVIACAESVYLRDDLGEGDKADESRLFQSALADGGEIDAAIHARTHLPPGLVAPA